MDIKNLINGLKKKDALTEQQLYALLYKHLFKVPLAYCKDKDEATLIFNQSMLYVFKNMKIFTDQTALLKWVHHILKNDCIDQIRKNTVYKNKLSVIGKLEKNWTNNDAINKLNMEDIISCIQKLENSYRLCFIMFQLEGCTHKEIGDRLNISQNTSKWYLSEAKKRLRKLIDAKDIVSYSKTQSNF